MHPWHDIKLGPEFPDKVPAVVEIPKDSKSKYALDNETGMLRLKHVLLTAARYPTNYGFIPQTIEADGDALDILVINQEPILAMSVLDVRIIGGISIKSKLKGIEQRILSVDANDPECSNIESINDMAPHLIDEVIQFFETYRTLEHDPIKFHDRYGKGTAKRILTESHQRYKKRLIVPAA
jgi:inorganic pyrophosphatase